MWSFSPKFGSYDEEPRTSMIGNIPLGLVPSVMPPPSRRRRRRSDGAVMMRVISEVNDRPVGNPKSKV
jgi:hypothetical protein